MPQGGNFTWKDFDKETSNWSFHTGAVTAVSLPGLLTQFGALRAALANITIGTITKEQQTVFETRLANAPPADPNAQRERKWLLTYEDNQPFFDPPVNAIPNEGFGRVITTEIPTADFTGTHLLPNTDQANLADAEIAAFVAAYEAIARSPYGGTVNVLGLTAVGRNL